MTAGFVGLACRQVACRHPAEAASAAARRLRRPPPPSPPPPLPPGACGLWFADWGHDGGDDLTRIALAPEEMAPEGMAVADGGVVVRATNAAHSWSPAYGVAGPGTTLTIYFGGVRTVGAYKSDEGGRIDFANGQSWRRASPLYTYSTHEGKNVKGACADAPGELDLGGCDSDDDCQFKCGCAGLGYAQRQPRDSAVPVGIHFGSCPELS